MTSPSISLVISTYNQPAALAKAFAGVRRQTQPPAEILIADDGSDEPTRALIRNFSESSPVPVKHVWQPHDGFRKTVILNQTVAAAWGEYMIFTDGDCVPHPRFVADHADWRKRAFGCRGGAVLCARDLSRPLRRSSCPPWHGC